MRKARSSNFMWNVIFLLFLVAVGVVSFQLLNKREAFSSKMDVDKIKKGNGVIVVTMKNCPHCESMKADLETMSKSPEMKGYFAWVDSKDKSVDDLALTSYPSILVFKDGEKEEYTEDRSLEKLMELVKSTKRA